MMKIHNAKRKCIAYLVLLVLLICFLFQNYFLREFYIVTKEQFIHIRSNQSKRYLNADNLTQAKTSNSSSLPELTMPSFEKKDSYWQPVDDESTAFVFSAYFVHEARTVAIIAIRKQIKAYFYFCHFWYKGEKNRFELSHQTQVKIIGLPKIHGLPYAAELFECQMPSFYSPPLYVSIVDINCSVPRNILYVQHVTKPAAVRRNFTLCLPPLFGNPNIYRFVEWVEFNKMLGAEKLYVYNYTSDAKIHKVLKFYSNIGFIDIIQWNLPDREKQDNISQPIKVHYGGQIAALNDCLYRNKYESEFIVDIDFDEFIIPHINNVSTWHHILTHVGRNKTVYIFRNTFFRKEWDNANIHISNKTLVKMYNLITLQKLQHEEKIFEPEIRSKYFVRTSRVSSLMIHTVLNTTLFTIPVNIALLHHYRDRNITKYSETGKVLDKTVPDKYKDVLIKKVKSVWLELEKTMSDVGQEK